MTRIAEDERLLAWSPLGFLRDHRTGLLEHAAAAVDATQSSPGVRAMTAEGGAATLWVQRLVWDSTHFGCPIERIDWVDDGAGGAAAVASAATTLVRELAANEPVFSISAEVPAEDTVTLAGLGTAGFRLVETRVTFYRDDLQASDWPERSATRLATDADIADLRDVAARARNAFDRYHADPFFPPAVADGYLATYAEQSVRGFADVVVVPDDPPGARAGAFFTARVSAPPACALGVDHACTLGIGVGRIVLVAVSPERQGWHLRLMAETTRRFRERGLGVSVMNTQITNRAVIRNSEKLGYRFGRATHVLVASAGTAPERSDRP